MSAPLTITLATLHGDVQRLVKDIESLSDQVREQSEGRIRVAILSERIDSLAEGAKRISERVNRMEEIMDQQADSRTDADKALGARIDAIRRDLAGNAPTRAVEADVSALRERLAVAEAKIEAQDAEKKMNQRKAAGAGAGLAAVIVPLILYLIQALTGQPVPQVATQPTLTPDVAGPTPDTRDVTE